MSGTSCFQCCYCGKQKVTLSSDIPTKWRSCKNFLNQRESEYDDNPYESTPCDALVCSSKDCKDWMKNHEMYDCKSISDDFRAEMTVNSSEQDVADDNSSSGKPTAICYQQDVFDDKKVLHIVEVPDIATVSTLYNYIDFIQTELSLSQQRPVTIDGLFYKRDHTTHLPSSNQKGMFAPIQNQAQFVQFKANLETVSKKKPGTPQVTPHFTLQITEKVLEQELHVTKTLAKPKSAPVTLYGSTDRVPVNNQHPPDRENSMLAGAFASSRSSSVGSLVPLHANKKQKFKLENNEDHFSKQLLLLHPFLATEKEFHGLWLHGNDSVCIYNEF